MLNISENRVNDQIPADQIRSLVKVDQKRSAGRWFLGPAIIFTISLLVLFLPWTQNVQSSGYLTTLYPEQHPQAIQSIISGRIEKWYIREGDYVHAGDTIVFISEVKSEYFDPELPERTAEQLEAVSQSIGTYEDKMKALDGQIAALIAVKDLKIAQTKNKLLQTRVQMHSDSADLLALEKNLQIAENQNQRTAELYERGLKSLTEYESARVKVQDLTAKVQVQKNQLLQLQNQAENLQLDLLATEQEYADKVAKARAEKFSTNADQLSAVANTAKLRNLLANYQMRQSYYYVTAPQEGYITKALQKGIGEIISEGTDLITIMPGSYSLAVESYIKPNDLPLVRKGDRVQILFDGWPTLAISGWPEISTGTFSGSVVAIDQFISENGRYRILIAPAGRKKEWPVQLRIGSGAKTFILLKNVPLWFEIWRKLNGFPADYYRNEAEKNVMPKEKAPLRSVK